MKRLLAACFALLILIGCSCARQLPAYQDEPRVRGSVARVEHVGSYRAITLRLLLWYAAPEPVPISHGIDLYRISYWSRVDDNPVLLSGLMAVPKTGSIRGTVLYMHGTNLDRRTSISNRILKRAC